MDGSDFSTCLTSLLCQEDGACLDDYDFEEEEENGLTESEDEYIGTLVVRESSFDCRTSEVSSSKDDWLGRARCDAVRWILKMKVFLGFSFHTAYLSVTYLDRFLLQRSINEEKLWAIRLLSVACLSLAAKMDELIVPSLSEYRIDDYRFESSAVQRMELLVLNTLEWRMRSVTPFDYLDYFASKFGCKSKVSLCKEAAELILIVMEDMNLMDHRPSAIAAAAILIALDEEVTEKLLEFKMGAMSSIGSIEIEHVFSCYNTMQEFQMRKNKVTNLFTYSDLASPTCTSNNNSSIDVSSVATKRRLGSNVCDCDFGIDKKTRLD